jgi:hypothetical protein
MTEKVNDWQPQGTEQDGKYYPATVGQICRWGACTVAEISTEVPEDERNEIARDIFVALKYHDDLINALLEMLGFNENYNYSGNVEMAKGCAEAHRLIQKIGKEL